MSNLKTFNTGIKVPLLVAILSITLVVSGMGVADAVPMPAKQFGKKTMEKLKVAEIKDSQKSSDKKLSLTKNHKGLQADLKTEKVKSDKKLSEQQKAMEKILKMYHKNPYVKSPYK